MSYIRNSIRLGAARGQINERIGHARATMEYHRTRDTLHVMTVLGHRSIKTAPRGTLLVALANDAYTCRIAGNVDPATQLVEAGCDCVTDIDEHRLFRRRKWYPSPSKRARSLVKASGLGESSRILVPVLLDRIRTLACGAGDPGFKSQRARQNQTGPNAGFDYRGLGRSLSS